MPHKVRPTILTSGTYTPVVGSFMMRGKSIIRGWIGCRDVFQGQLNSRFMSSDRCSFYFLSSVHIGDKPFSYGSRHKPLVEKSDNVIKFIADIEDRMKLPKSNRCIIKKTTVDGVIVVFLSKFWSTPMRSSFLTAALRCGLCYLGNFNETLYNGPFSYFRRTKKATDKFLKGSFNDYSGSNPRFYSGTGWVNRFRDGKNLKTIGKE